METKILKKMLLLFFSIGLISFLSILPVTSFAQSQIGGDIDGEDEGDYSGYSVSMPNNTIVAIGARNNDGGGAKRGHVRVYEYENSSWGIMGNANDIDGRVDYEYSGYSVSMPCDTIVAIGSPYHGAGGTERGLIRIYSFNGSQWEQIGDSIVGDANYDHFGFCVSMPDEYTVAIGAPYYGDDRGHVKVYRREVNAQEIVWTQRGSDIIGAGDYDEAGFSISMPDDETIAIGSPADESDQGHIRVFEWDGDSWERKGDPIAGEATGDKFGWSVSMPDANTVAIGAPYNSGTSKGHVRVYYWYNNAWSQKGSDIDGEANSDQSGWSVSMPDAGTVAIGAIYNDGGGGNNGHVRVYEWTNGLPPAWVQVGNDIDGEDYGDRSGWSVSMPDNETVGIGAPWNDGGGTDAGHVRIWDLSGAKSKITYISGEGIDANYNIYPNPTDGNIMIEFDNSQENVSIELYSIIGELLETKQIYEANQVEFKIIGEPGVYLLRISDQNGQSSNIRIIKN